MSFRFVHITDLHLSDHEFHNHVAGVQEELWTMLDEVWQLCKARDAHLIVTGDFFDKKSPVHTSHRLVQRLIEFFKRWQTIDKDVFAIAGNHDLSQEGMASLYKQPLGVIAASGAITLLREPQLILHTDEPTAMMIQLTPLNYEERAEYDPEFYRVPVPAEIVPIDYHIVLAHGMLAPAGRTYPYDYIPWDQVPVDGVDMMVYGHPHDRHGADVVNGCVFMSYGSFCRRSRVQKRRVSVGFVELTNEAIHYEEIVLKTARHWKDLFTEVVAGEDEDEPDVNPERLRLVEDVRNLLFAEDVDFRELLQKFSGIETKEVIDCAYKYLEAAESRR